MKIKNNILKASVLLISVLVTSATFGQKGIEDGSKYGQGQDSIDCLTNTSLYREYARQKMYKEAVKYWRYCFNYCPYSSRNVYLDGVKIFKDFQEKELDVEKKEKYIDSVLLVYDMRIKYGFGDEGYVNQYKGLDLLQMRSDNPEALLMVYNCFKTSVTQMKAKAMKPVFQNYTKVGINLYNQGKLDMETLLQDYLYVIDVLEKKGNDKLINEINEQMVSSGILSCDQLISMYTPKYEANPKDLKLLITITDFLDKLNCEDSELYYKALSDRHSLEPTSESARQLAALALKNEKYDDAIKFAQEAIESESDDLKKAELYLQLALAYNKKGNKVQARIQAQNAIKLNPKSGEPYLFIGSLYAESTTECKNLNLPKSIYWVAVDYFIKAKQVDASVADKANKNIATYSQYFPNKEEAFFHGVKEGNSYTVECWINETTTARFGD